MISVALHAGGTLMRSALWGILRLDSRGDCCQRSVWSAGFSFCLQSTSQACPSAGVCVHRGRTGAGVVSWHATVTRRLPGPGRLCWPMSHGPPSAPAWRSLRDGPPCCFQSKPPQAFLGGSLSSTHALPLYDTDCAAPCIAHQFMPHAKLHVQSLISSL